MKSNQGIVKDIFFAKSTGCATCHCGPDYTDRKKHEVGTGGDDPSEEMGPEYDTPSLNRVYRNLSFLHHGKAKTLEEAFTRYNSEDKHGETSHLSKRQIEDLVEFLVSLPYDKP